MRSSYRPAASAVLVLFLCFAALPAPAQDGEWSITSLSSEIRGLTEKVSPAVVQVYTSSFGPLMGSLPEGAAIFGKQHATGSGVIVDSEGYIITNNHVVQGAKRVQVRLAPEAVGDDAGSSILASGGAIVGAQVIGTDPETDLAVLKINRKDLPVLEFGDSDEIFQGQLVFAFGSPMGLTNSVSFGVVSTVARQLERDNPMIYIQTDVAINPGNSGGPLVNARGEVIGINTLIFTQSGGSEGLSFSAPSNIVRSIYNKIRAYGRVRRGIVGVNAQTLNPYMAQALGMDSDWGVILGDVHPDGPAAQAGLQIGDVVLSLDGKKMENARQFNVNVYGKPVGEKVTIEVRRSGQVLSKNVSVLERRDPDNRFVDRVTTEQNLVKKLGLLCLDLDDELLQMMSYPPRGQQGVIVAALAVDEMLMGEQFYPGDIIYAVNNMGVSSLKDLRLKLKELPYGQVAVFQLERGGQLRYLMLSME